MKIENICCIGAGYVGGPTMAVIADRCKHVKVTVVDVNSERINEWNSKNLPVFEPGLDSLVAGRINKNLFFSTRVDEAIAEADCIFISVNTPTKLSGEGAGKASDLRFLEASARRIAESAKGHTIVVEKSTLPVKSAEKVQLVLEAVGKGRSFDVLSNPEFLAEGTAIRDLLEPDRVLIGGQSQEACTCLSRIYENWVPPEKIIKTNLWSAEMAKLAANAFLAQRVSSINALSALCELTGANIREVSDAIGLDSRIGSKFLKAGPGFGGSCFKKDILNLVYLCEYHGLKEVAHYWEQVVFINEWQKKRVARLIVEKLFNTVFGKKIVLLGFAFKKDTNDVRETPANSICRDLLIEGANIFIYDPKVSSATIQNEVEKYGLDCCPKVNCLNNLNKALEDADAAVLITDWDEFCSIDWAYAQRVMRKPAWVFDTRGVLPRVQIEEQKINFWSVGVK